MALPSSFLDELRVRTPLPAVVGRRVKLARSGRNWKGCCPFHGEKTPSFYVYDDHFHCFGCGAHGDAIGFVMQSQGAGFPEAVEQLAAEAGLEVPKPSPEAAEAERRRHDLHAVLEAASASFQRRLFLPEGRAALDYLRGRGLSEETIRRFGLGWSGEGRGALAAELGREGIAPEQLLAAGLMREAAEPGGRPYDLFFNRVMFPIRDRRGRLISFGGRTLGDGVPKYVNGPETDLFSKRRTLYALDLAREGTRTGAELVVVEGYMDVIALHQAGFTGAVAPLGTALTEEQCGELWRISPAPVLCFDGDAAGGRAAARAAELVLPMLAPDRTVRVAALAADQDPDTLIRGQGAAAFQGVLDGARPLSVALYDLLREGHGAATPEQRAAFRTRLEEAARKIPDRALSSEYRSVLLDLFFSNRPSLRGRGGTARAPLPAGPPPRRPPSGTAATGERGRILVAILLLHPDLLTDVGDTFRRLDLPPLLDRVRAALLDWRDRLQDEGEDGENRAQTLDSTALMTHLTEIGLDAEAAQVLSAVPFPLPGFASAIAMPAEAEEGWWHIFGLMNRAQLEEEVAAARLTFIERCDEASERRLVALRRALGRLDQGSEDDT